MNTMTMAQPSWTNSKLAQFFQSALEGSRMLTFNAYAMFAAFAVCAALQFVDGREFNGINIWIKPGKFYFSMAVHFITVAWALSLLNAQQRTSKVIIGSVWVMIFSAWLELLYITYRASQVDASHYNVGTPLNAAIYSAMAAFAVFLMIAPAVIGVKIWREKRGELWAQSVGLGFGLAAVLTIIVGMTLGSNSSHWIGGDLTDATGLPIFKWSTTGGDLRVSHFIGMHALQLVPFAALSGKRSIVLATAGVVTVLTALTFVQALYGVPLLRG